MLRCRILYKEFYKTKQSTPSIGAVAPHGRGNSSVYILTAVKPHTFRCVDTQRSLLFLPEHFPEKFLYRDLLLKQPRLALSEADLLCFQPFFLFSLRTQNPFHIGLSRYRKYSASSHSSSESSEILFRERDIYSLLVILVFGCSLSNI